MAAKATLRVPGPDAARTRDIRRRLLAWFRLHRRDLPWRRTADPYAIWISEIILQQTRVEQGRPYYERFLARFPDVHALARADLDTVLKLWEGLGYYSRARNLHKAARAVAGEHGGRFPETVSGLEALPGVGRYTAGAIASIAFGVRTPVLDGNVIRVLTRLFDVRACSDDTAVKHALWELAGALVPRRAPGDFNQAMMELGATLCTPKRPRCGVCPLARHCAAQARGVQEARPVRKPKKAIPREAWVAAALGKNGRYLIAKRPEGSMLAGLWELPGGKVKAGESHTAALRRILREELGLDVKVGRHLGSTGHAYSHLRIELSVYACAPASGKLQTRRYTEMKWVTKKQLDRYAFHKACQKLLPLLGSMRAGRQEGP